MHLPDVWRMRGLVDDGAPTARVAICGPTLILSGSCSAATLGQLQQFEATGCASIAVDVARLTKDGPGEISRLALAAEAVLQTEASVVVRSSAPAEARSSVSPEAASAIESAFGELARRLVCTGLSRRVIVAGGETAGAVVNALDIAAAEVTGILDPGVPALRTLDDAPLALALKSGNFGSPDFFEKTIQWWDHNES